ncbi:hypothetical protein [Halorubrum tibetense]
MARRVSRSWPDTGLRIPRDVDGFVRQLATNTEEERPVGQHREVSP